jgi:cytidylate kinase
LRRGISPGNPGALADFASDVSIEVRASASTTRVLIAGADATPYLRTPEVESNVSLVSRVPGVRTALVRIQRDLGRAGRVVMAGRDIGSVVLPDADLKVYLDASRDVRARRRADQLRAAGEVADLEAIRADLERRDGIDSSREVSPLTAAPGAVIINTDHLTIGQVVDRIVELAA